MNDNVDSVVRHRQYADTTFHRRPRMTCDCGATLVRQPWMTDAVWRSRVRRFERGEECRHVPNASLEARAETTKQGGLGNE